MLDNIINKNISFLQRHGVKMDGEDDRAVYKYGLQILYYYVIDLLVIFSLAYIFGRLYETAIMTFIFGLLQVFGGGYHAKTPLKCLAVMIAGAIAGNILMVLIVNQIISNIVLIIIFCSIIFISKPVVNKNHPVSKKIDNRSKLIVRVIISLIFLLATVLFYFSRFEEITAVAVALGLYLISLIYAKMS